MPDQCSDKRKVFPQGECPTSFKYEGDSAESKVLIRDFTPYKYKYFPLTDVQGNGIFHAVCVKECPTKLYTAKKYVGDC